MSLRDAIKLEGLDLAIGECSGHMVCPVCNGGSSGASTMVITRVESGLLYYCHRASCGTRGFVSSIGSSLVEGRKAKSPKSKPYIRETVNPPERVLMWLHDSFKIAPKVAGIEGWKWNEETQRLIMPIRNERWFVIGHNARYWQELDEIGVERDRAGAKSITYWNNPDVPKFHMPILSSRGGTLVLVEDQPSAVRLAGSVDCIALLGTYLSPEVAKSLIALGYDRLVISLDNDATAKAIATRKKYGLFFPRMDVVPLLGPDIKDMTDEEYEDYLRMLR